MTIFTRESLNIAWFVMSDSMLYYSVWCTSYTSWNVDRWNCNLVLFPYFLTYLDWKFYCVNVFATNLSELVVCTVASPVFTYLDYIIGSLWGLRVYPVLNIWNWKPRTTFCYKKCKTTSKSKYVLLLYKKRWWYFLDCIIKNKT